VLTGAEGQKGVVNRHSGVFYYPVIQSANKTCRHYLVHFWDFLWH